MAARISVVKGLNVSNQWYNPYSVSPSVISKKNMRPELK
jgi:hypothetical protein